MSRPCKCRRVCALPGATYFKPAGIPLRLLEENTISIEEMEAIRLRDIEGFEQAQCAGAMNVSHATFQRVLASARAKVADSLLCGKALRIQGGNYELAGTVAPSRETKGSKPAAGGLIASGDTEEIQVKIAVVTEDGVNVSQHFGRAPWYAVFTVDKGQIISREKRAKIGHHEFAGQESHSEGAGPHGYDAESEQRHLGMMSAIPDCQVVIAGGMGMAAYDSIRDRGIEAVITDVRNAEEAAKLQSLGRLPNLKERLH